MKKYIFLLAGLLLPILSYCQTIDTAKSAKLLTASPLLGGISLTNIVTPVKLNGNTFVIQQPIVDFGIPVYKDVSNVHSLLIKTGIRYQGLFLTDEQRIDGNAFHSVTVPLLVNYSLSRTTSISFIGLATVASDFKSAMEASDILYTLGLRIGFRPSNKFKYGFTLIHVYNYSGSLLLPVPDIDWAISNKLNFTAILPARASLKYKLSAQQSLGVTFGLGGSMYRLNTGSQPQYLHLQQVSAGLVYDLKLGRRWKFTAVAGRTLSQKLETFNNDQRVPFNGFSKLNDREANISYRQNSFIFNGGISYSF